MCGCSLRHWVERIVLICAFIVIAAFTPAKAYAWGNGPDGGNGFGTHDWIVYKANQIALSRGVNWVDINTAMSASDDPDTVSIQWRMIDLSHEYGDVRNWPDFCNRCPAKAAETYAQAAAAIRRGDNSAASYYLGLLSHYFSDACDPLNTSYCSEESSMYYRYESMIDNMTNGPTAYPQWITDDGYAPVSDPAVLTGDAALFANKYYDVVVRALDPLPGYESPWIGKSVPCLNRAVNDLADMITMLGGGLVPEPNAIYRFYNVTNGTHFYTPSEDEARTVLAKWRGVYQYEGICYFANPTKNTQPLYRFYNKKNRSHFYTCSSDEAGIVLSRWSSIYTYEGQTYSVCPTPVSGSTTIYRFYNMKNGSHFYTASAEERDAVITRWSSTYQYEGPAFWVVP